MPTSLAVLALLGACSTDGPVHPAVGLAQLALQGPQDDVATLCGFACADRGLMEGNGRPSGVTSPDAFFTTVLAWRDEAESLSGQIERAMAAAAADFGVSGDLGAEIQSLHAVFAEGPLRAHSGSPDCRVDGPVLSEWLRRCDPSLTEDVGECAGRCELARDAESTDCADGTDRLCSFAVVSERCDGLCLGVCLQSDVDGECSGDCLGACSGSCSQLDASGDCAGHCSGSCQGQCALPQLDAASCEGECLGSCQQTNPSDCADALRVQCVAPSSGETVPCDGRCDGAHEQPGARLECAAAAAAQASLTLHCTPAGARLRAAPAAMVDEPALQSRYFSALSNLEQRLPELWVLAERGERIFASGDDLTKAAADRAMADSINELNAGELHTRFAVGLQCAEAQLPSVEQVIANVSPRLEANLEALDELRSGLGLEMGQ